MIKRILDIGLSLIAIALLFVPFLIICFFVRITSAGPILHWSKRIGIDNKIFLMPKFRTMKINTPQVATHLMLQPEKYLTPIGGFLRKTSLDELPQIISVLKGDMSWVGPRPALFNQDDLMQLRTSLEIHRLKPGITGWAQVNGRDELPIPVKVQYDKEYLQRQSILFDLKILFLTLLKVFRSEGVSH